APRARSLSRAWWSSEVASAVRPQHRAHVGDRRDLAARELHHARRGCDELAVGLRHLAAGQIEVVLETDSNVPAERERRHAQRPLIAADADDLPARTGGDI